MNSQCISTDEIIHDYRAAIEHAKGNVFASMVQVSFADGWFKVRDLEGTESRYRKKEMLSLTHSLLKEPEFEEGSAFDLAPATDTAAPQMAAPALQKEARPAAPVQVSPISEPLRMTEKADEEVFLRAMEPPNTYQEPMVAEVIPMKQASRSSANENSSSADAKSAATVAVKESSRIIELNKPALAPALDRQLENKTYLRNLVKILAVVAAVFGVLIGWMLWKGN